MTVEDKQMASIEAGKLMPHVAAKLMLLLFIWAVTAVVTCLFASDTYAAAAAFIKAESESFSSVIPVISAVVAVCVLYLVATFEKSPNRFIHAAEFMSEIADDLGSALFLLGWTVLLIFLAMPSIERGVLASFGLVFGITLITLSKRFGA